MSLSMIAAIRTQKQLRGNRFLIALELAALMTVHGRKRVAYQYLAYKAHCSKRTAIAAMRDLVRWGIFACLPQTGPSGDEINLYICLVPVPRGFRAPPATTRSATSASTLPLTTEGEKPGPSLREQIRLAERGIQFLTPGTIAYQSAWSHLERLRGLSSPP